MAGPKREENTISRIYTLQDLQARSLPELHILRGALQRELALTVPYSAAAGEIFACLRVIEFAIARPVGLAASGRHEEGARKLRIGRL